MESSLRHEEDQPLLLSSVAGGQQSHNKRKKFNNQILKDICLPSKAAVLLVCLTMVIGALHAVFTCVFVACAVYFVGGKYINQSAAICLSYLVTLAGQAPTFEGLARLQLANGDEILILHV